MKKLLGIIFLSTICVASPIRFEKGGISFSKNSEITDEIEKQPENKLKIKLEKKEIKSKIMALQAELDKKIISESMKIKLLNREWINYKLQTGNISKDEVVQYLDILKI